MHREDCIIPALHVTSSRNRVTLPLMIRAFPWLVLFFITLITSGTYAIIKYLTGFVGPTELLLLRFLPASILAIILVAIFFRAAALRILAKSWPFFLLRETIAVLGFHLTLVYAESKLPAGVSALIVGIWPVITFLIASAFIGESLTARKLTGGIVAFVGAAAVILFGAGYESGQETISTADWTQYSLILLIAPVSSAIVTTLTRWYLSRNDGPEPPDSFLFSLICRMPSGIMVLIVYLLFHQSEPLFVTLRDLPPLFWLFIAVISFYNSLIGFWLWNWTIQKLHAGAVASFSYIQNALALIVAWIFLGETLSAVKVFGAVAIVIGVLVANIDFNRNSSGTSSPHP